MPVDYLRGMNGEESHSKVARVQLRQSDKALTTLLGNIIDDCKRRQGFLCVDGALLLCLLVVAIPFHISGAKINIVLEYPEKCAPIIKRPS